MSVPRTVMGQLYRDEAENGGLGKAVAEAIYAAGHLPKPGTLHVLIDSDSNDDPMLWAAMFLDSPSE